MSSNEIIFEINESDQVEFKRLDVYLAKQLPDLSRSLIKKLFEDDKFQSLSKLELKKMPKTGTIITYLPGEPNDTNIVSENIPLDILFEDEYLMIINKAAGMVVHPAPGNYTGTLVNAVLHHCPDLNGIGNEKRPGIVHRLDKGTSGIMVVAKEQRAHNGLVELFSTHDIKRQYEAICMGSRIPPEQKLIAPIGRSPHNRLKMEINVKNAKEAITYLETIEYFEGLAHVQLTLETGRTHQIRVHLSSLLHSPILNDQTYGRIKEQSHIISSKMKQLIKGYEHPFLHAKILGFVHPITKKELYFEQAPPQIFLNVLNQLKIENE
jgi:23S rRNA pseudouridine1911/1915/1917 synthase